VHAHESRHHRHKGYQINEEADRAAKRGCRFDHELLSDTLSYHAEKRSRLVQEGWQKELQANPLTGAFREVTHRPPTTRPDKVFLQLEKEPEVFGRLTQMRTMHGHNPSYFARIKIDHDPLCVCGHELLPNPPRRFRNHVLHNCEAYEDHRHILTAVSRHHDAPFLLGTVKGLCATAKFLKKTGAFTATGLPYEPPPPPIIPGLRLHDPPILDDPP